MERKCKVIHRGKLYLCLDIWSLGLITHDVYDSTAPTYWSNCFIHQLIHQDFLFLDETKVCL